MTAHLDLNFSMKSMETDMIDMTKTYRTRDGREVRIYAVDGAGKHCVHGAYREDDEWHATAWTSYGDHSYSHDKKLIEVKPRIKRTMWVNVYDGIECLHKRAESAKMGRIMGNGGCLACVKIEIDCEEGEGL